MRGNMHARVVAGVKLLLLCGYCGRGIKHVCVCVGVEVVLCWCEVIVDVEPGMCVWLYVWNCCSC